MKPTYGELLDALEGMVGQHAEIQGQPNSMVISTNAEAIRLLAQAGRIRITREHGRAVVGEWVSGRLEACGGTSE